MGEKCHFAHRKEDVRNPGDPLPPDTPFMSEPKILALNAVGLACLDPSEEILHELAIKGKKFIHGSF